MFDIFSNIQEYEEHKRIIVDHREKNSLVISELVQQKIKFSFEQLIIGDYIVGDTIIERKTVMDYKNSLINGRLFGQVAQLSKSKRAIIIIEGILKEDIYSGKIHENAIRGSLLSIASNFQIPIIYTYDEKDTAKYIAILAKKNGKELIKIRMQKRPRSFEEQQKFILEGFPGIGPSSAKKLLQKFKSIKGIINAGLEELNLVIGSKSKELHRAINDVSTHQPESHNTSFGG